MSIVKLDQLSINTKGSYLVHHLIPRHDLTVVWGNPKSGKTFWVLDLAMHVAAGLRYRDRDTINGPVVYFTLEGGWEFGARAHAAARRTGVDVERIPFFCSTDRRTFTKVGGADGLIGEVQKLLSEPVLVVLDTLNRSIDGSENSDEDMSHYLHCAENIADAFNCAVIIVHHGRKSGDTPRGHTSLTGTCAAQLWTKVAASASPSNNQMISVMVQFMKDGPEGTVLLSWLRPVVVGKNDDDQPIESCYIEEAPASALQSMSGGMLPPQAQKALAVLQELMTETDNERVKMSQWHGACDLIPLAKTGNAAKTAFHRAFKLLQSKGIVVVSDNIWVSLGSGSR